MAPSLKDVARLAGVNASTASRAIRGDPTQRINVETRRRVLAAATELGYRANYLGRSLRVRRTGTLGLVVPDLDFVTFVDITHGVQAAAIEHDRSLLLVEVNQFARAGRKAPADELIYQRLVAEGRVDGLLIGSRTLEDAHVLRLAERRFPLVLVNRGLAGVPTVTGPDEEACRLAVDYLARHGHRRVGMVGVDVPGEDVGSRRDGAFRRSVLDLGLDPDPDLIISSAMSDPDGRAAVQRLLERTADKPPTALFVASFSIGLGVLEGIRAMGVRIPDQLSVITFPEHRLAGHTNPPLTTVTASMFRLGQEAGRLLIGIIDGQEPRSIRLEETPHVVDRGSVIHVSPTRPLRAARLASHG